jgi:hypothetical protein
MAIEVFTPQIEVTLIKTTGLANGQAYRGASSGVDFADISELLGDYGGVQTVKTVDGDPGAFSIVFADGVQADLQDTAYALIEPMDMVEIRMARRSGEARSGNGGRLPLVMRGFVSTIERDEVMTEHGPKRAVIVRGQDETKLWYNFGIFPEQVFLRTGDFLDRFAQLAATKVGLRAMQVSAYMEALVEIVNAKVGEMSAYTGAGIPEFIPSCTVPQGIAIGALVAPFRNGPFWQLAETMADRPWNEMFIESTEDGPVFVFRPTPFFRLDGGGLIMPGAADPGYFERDAEHVIRWRSRRSDQRVANFFWTDMAGGQLDTFGGVSVSAQRTSNVDTFEHPNSALNIFGARRMKGTTRLLPDGFVQAPLNAPPGQKEQEIQSQNDWHVLRAQQLRDMNMDNVAFEEVDLTMQGHEELRVGRYLRITRGQEYGEGLLTTGYITRVAHSFQPMRSFTTQVQLERSDGFVNRDASSGMPYFFEGRAGPYTRG